MAYKNLKKVLKKRSLRREHKNLFQGESLEPRHAFDGSDALDAALVISPNQAPVNNLPAEQTTFVNQPFAFTPYKGNVISISDADAGQSHLRVTLDSKNGMMLSVNPDPRGGVTYLEGDGIDDRRIIVEGTVADLNGFFQWFVFKPDEGFKGNAGLTIKTSDLGNGSISRELTDEDTLSISVMPIPDYEPSPGFLTYPGMLDPTFFSNGLHLLNITDGADSVEDMHVLDNGKILAVGKANGKAAVFRFNQDLTLDEAFGEKGGWTSLKTSRRGFETVLIDNEGRILCFGRGDIARFTADGLLDTTFGAPDQDGKRQGFTRAHYSSYGAIRADGSIVTSSHDYYSLMSVYSSDGDLQNQTRNFHLGKYIEPAGFITNPDGSTTVIADSGYHTFLHEADRVFSNKDKRGYDLGVDQEEEVTTILPMKDGGILLVGHVNNNLSVSRFKRDGSLDRNFGVDGVTVVPILSGRDVGHRATIAPDGKIVIAGHAENGENKDFVIVRLNKNGSVDESFGNSGKFVTNWGGDDQAYAVAILPNGKILAAGKAGNSIGFVQLLGDSRVGVPVSTVYLSETSTVENGAPGSVIGFLTTDSATDNSETTYALVSGSGGIDNDAFTIVGSELQSAASFDYETKSSYTVRVRATTVDGHVVEQAFSILIENANDLPTGSVEISGVPTAGETLVAENSIFDQDGVGTLEYQWSRDGVAIEGATAETYTLSAADVGAVIAVRVNYIDAQGTAETVTSGGTSPVAAANQAPFGLNLSAAVIAENKIAGSVVGELSASDPDADDLLTYSLVSGDGDTENDSFEIVGSELRAAESFDFEIQNQYSIRVRATDSAGLLTEKTFSIGISNVNEAPFDLTISAETITENAVAGSVVGTLTAADPDAEDVLTYSLVDGEEETDNDLFEVVGDELRTKIWSQFDYESKSSYTVRLRATDSEGSLTEQTFVIAINDINEVPFDLSLSSLIVLENAAVGAVVGELNAIDPDADDELTYSLAVGEGDTDNSQFEMVSNELRAKQSFNFEAKSSYGVRIRATDSAGLVTEKAFGISVGNVNESPFELTASSTDIAENNIAGRVVGEFSAVDQDAGDILTFSLAAGEGDVGNSSFEIIGNELRTTEIFDFESQSSYSIRVRAADSEGLHTEKVFGIAISNVNEAPFGLSLSSLLVLENASAGTVIGELSALDPDADDVLTYSLVAGEGDADNAFFEIISAELRATESFDFESQNSYSVRVRAVDTAGLATDKTFNIAVVNANDAPSGSVIINGIAEEGKELRATNDLADQDGLGAISYQWKRNDTEIEGAVADAYMLSQADVGSVIAVTVSYTDSQGTYEEIDSDPTSLVTAANKAPSELGLSSTQIQENKVPGTVVGGLSAVDPDADDVLTYSLVVGEGDADNNSFEINGAELRATKTFDYEMKSSYSVRVRVTDSGGLYFEKVFSIEVTDVDGTVATGTTFDYLILEAQQAGSTVDIDDIRVTDLGSNTVVFENDFETDDLTGVELLHSQDSGDEYSENLEMTRIQDGRLRLETTGFLQNGAGGYNSRSRMVIPNQLPDEFEITFTARKLQWAGHFKVILGNSESDYADISTQNGNEFGVHDGDYGFYVHQAGGVAPTPAGVLINLDGEVVELPTQTTLTNLHNTDAKYRIVRQAKELSLYINDNLIATKNDLLDPNSAVEDSIDVDVPLVIAAEEGVISLDAEITYDPNVVQLHDIAADANLPEGTIAMLTEIAPGRSYLGIMTTPALGDASYVLGSLSATITGSSETLASLVTFENVQLNEGAVSAYDADGNLIIRLGNTAPTGISLSGTEVAENSPLYTAVGSFETTDIDTTDQFTYQLVAGDGAVDNSDFVVDGNVLRTLSPLDYETQSSYSVRVRSTDTTGQSVEQVFTITVGDVIESLMVTGLTSNQSGFTVSFNEAVSEEQLNLYDGFGTYGAADVTITGAVSGAVTGSAVLSDDGMSLVFVSSTPLVNDSYTVVLNSGEKAFIGVDGRLLDGNSDGTAGDNYTQSFIVDDAVSTVVSTPSFARAPGESVDLGTGTQRGLPVQLDSDGSVQSVAFTVEFDPAVISVDSVEKGVTLPVDALITYDMVQPGVISIAITTSEMISAGAATVAVINASVIENVDYASSSIVTIKDVVLNSGQVAGAGSSAVHVASRLGDTSGDGNYSGFDAVLAARLAAFKDTGLAAYPMVDPVVVADVSGNGDIRMYDSGLVASVPSDGSSVGPRNNASGNTTNVIFRQNGQFGSATVAPTVAGTNERVRAFLEYAKANKDQNFANAAAAVASGAGGSSNSGAGESINKKSKLLFAPLPVAK